jgi:hypothetical protein
VFVPVPLAVVATGTFSRPPAAVPEPLSSLATYDEGGADQERLEDMLRDAEADRATIMAKNAE